MTERKEQCWACREGQPRMPSSVNPDELVHPATKAGRVICTGVPETSAEQELRSLAAYFGNGGYNASSVDAKEFGEKIRAGADTITRVEVERALTAYRERVERIVAAVAKPYEAADECLPMIYIYGWRDCIESLKSELAKGDAK